MTAVEFGAKYKGRQVRVLPTTSYSHHLVGQVGIVDRSQYNSWWDRSYVIVGSFDCEFDSNAGYMFEPTDLEVIDLRDRTPLPLPG